MTWGAMLKWVHQSVFVFALALLVANVAYQFFLFELLDAELLLEAKGFLIFVLPIGLSIAAAIVPAASAPERDDWRNPARLILAVIIPPLAMLAFIVFQLWSCLDSGQKGCLP